MTEQLVSDATTTDDVDDNVADDDTPRFRNLNRDAKEASRSSFLDTNVMFRDLNALLEHFDGYEFGTGPIMILLAVRGPKAKQFFLCDPTETTIGNSVHASISISNDKRMAPYHSRLFFDSQLERWMLEDLQSSHGTFVKVPVEYPALVATGDVFVMGMTLVRIFGLQIPALQTGRCMNGQM